MLKLSENEKNKLISKTEENLRLAGRSEKTILNYHYDLLTFFRECNYKGNLKDFTEDDFLKYIRKQFINKGKSSNTYNASIASIKRMFLVNYKKTFINDLIPRAKTENRLPYFLPKDVFIDIFNKENKLEYKCWLILGFCCGLRACEIATLKIENINSKEYRLNVIGKRNKERVTILSDVVIKYLRLFYIDKHITYKEGYLFKGNKNKEHICERTVVNYFIDLKKKYNLDKRYTLHSLRHSFATYFLMNGGNLYELQQLMGHKNITSTCIYEHVCMNLKNLKGINYDKKVSDTTNI